MSQLKLWNGRAIDVLGNTRQSMHIYVAAHSIADLQRLCKELGLNVPSRHEIKTYWSNCWGNPMDGITAERGVWVGGRTQPPRRLTKGMAKRLIVQGAL